MAVAESLMNLIASDVQGGLSRVRLSANWMAAGNHPGEGAGLYEAVEAIGLDLCPKLGVSIPVGKDSMSMKMKWTDGDASKEVTAPISLVITAFAAVKDFRKTWTPQLKREEASRLVFIDLADSRMAMGGSAIAQVFRQVGDEAPDVRDVDEFKAFFEACKQVRDAGLVEAYHDRSDGGLFTTFAEMAFAGRVGVDVELGQYAKSLETSDLVEALFNEELGAVFQVLDTNLASFCGIFAAAGISVRHTYIIGTIKPVSNQNITFTYNSQLVYDAPRAELQQTWARTSHVMQRLRDNPKCADEEFGAILDDKDPGLSYNLTFSPDQISAPSSARPRIAILREQGINSHAEMAFAFHLAGFTPVDVHMTDLLSSRTSLDNFVGLAACGGFSYGDVLGAGAGWANSVLLHEGVREEFKQFFNRKETFALGVCNGCQFFSKLKDLIPGAEDWPSFERNQSEQYEARVCTIQISENSTPFLKKIAGSKIPIAVAHGEGRAVFKAGDLEKMEARGGVVMRYVDNYGKTTMQYPFNPNGSMGSVAGVVNSDGRVLAMMPHPERTVFGGAGSWLPQGKEGGWGGVGAWTGLFAGAREWVG
jgi:phosphoribosylformylglycinamidine synthase